MKNILFIILILPLIVMALNRDYWDNVEKTQENWEDNSIFIPVKRQPIPIISKSKLVPYYHSTPSLQCNCDLEHTLLDLGILFYPRYIHSVICKSGGCGRLMQCKGKHYNVRVLKKKHPKSNSNVAMSLPENLREFWEPDLVNVTVACECIV